MVSIGQQDEVLAKPGPQGSDQDFGFQDQSLPKLQSNI